MENKRNCCSSTPNAGVKCDVKNCVSHSGEKHCTAKCIAVGPNSAQTSADTICATFKQKAE